MYWLRNIFKKSIKHCYMSNCALSGHLSVAKNDLFLFLKIVSMANNDLFRYLKILSMANNDLLLYLKISKRFSDKKTSHY